jgi:hypothetical protein
MRALTYNIIYNYFIHKLGWAGRLQVVLLLKEKKLRTTVGL